MGKPAVPERHAGLRVVLAAEMAEIDRRAGAEFGLTALELMERAGRAVAGETARFLEARLGRAAREARLAVCCGRGNNGGDGLAAARHLAGRGARVAAFIAPPRREQGYGPEVAAQLKRALEAGVPVREAGEDLSGLEAALASADAAIDALLGTGSSGKPAGAVRAMIQALRKAGKPVIAVDIPSGLHPDTGYHSGVFVSAALTLALGLPKRGLLTAHAAKDVGELRVLDIGLPPRLTEPGAIPPRRGA